MSFPYPKTQSLLKNPPKNRGDYEHLLQTFAEEFLGNVSFPKDTIISLTEEEIENKLTWFYTLKHQSDYFEGHKTLDTADVDFSTLQDLLVYAAKKSAALSQT